MSWWACLWLALVVSMMTSWMIGPPVSYGGLLLWYLYDMFPVEKPPWPAAIGALFVKHPKDQYVTLHGSVLAKAFRDIVENVRIRGWTDEQVDEAVKGLFITAYEAGGTIDDLEHFNNLLLEKHGAPEGVIQH